MKCLSRVVALGAILTSLVTAGYSQATLLSITLADASPTNAATVNFTVSLDAPVSGINAGNFGLTGTATAGASIGTPTTVTNDVWTVPVSTGADGTLGLDMLNSVGTDLSVDNVPVAGPLYTIDKTGPVLSNIASSPATVIRGQTVSITFSSTEQLPTVRGVTVNGNAATYGSVSGAGPYVYTFSYVIGGAEAFGAATVQATGSDALGNPATPISNATILAVSSFDNGAVGGTLTLDATAAPSATNFKSLGDFCKAFNALTQVSTFAINAQWTVTIESNLDQPTNVWMANTVAAAAGITFKPGVGKTPVINFGQLADQNGLSGHWVFGQNPTLGTGTTGIDLGYVKTDNITIDGSNNGTSTRNLTFQNNGGVAGAVANGRFLTFGGSSSNFTVKNCILKNYTNTNTAMGIAVSGRGSIAATGNGNMLIPGNITIQNNDIDIIPVTGLVGTGQGISLTVSSNTTGGYVAPNNLTYGTVTIQSNIIRGKQRGIFLDYVANATVTDNKIALDCRTTGYAVAGIMHNRAFSGASATSPWTITVSRNVISQLKSVDAATNQTHYGLMLGPTNPGTGVNTLNMLNNQLAGFDIPSQLAGTGGVRGVHVNIGAASANAANSFNMYNNSINMGPNLTAAAMTSTLIGGVVFASSDFKVNMKNNIVRQTWLQAPAIRMANISNANLNADNNVYFHTDPTATCRLIQANPTGTVTVYNTLAAYKAAVGSKEAASQEIDPAGVGKTGAITIGGTTGGKWTSVAAAAADLHFDAKPTNLQGVTYIASVTDDADGEVRNTGATRSYPGFDEIPASPLPVGVSGFSIE